MKHSVDNPQIQLNCKVTSIVVGFDMKRTVHNPAHPYKYTNSNSNNTNTIVNQLQNKWIATWL